MNIYDYAKRELVCTNNGLEGWHYNFQKHVGGYHVSTWKMLESLKREIGLVKCWMVYIEAGKEESIKKRTTENIKNKVEIYSCDDIIQ